MSLSFPFLLIRIVSLQKKLFVFLQTVFNIFVYCNKKDSFQRAFSATSIQLFQQENDRKPHITNCPIIKYPSNSFPMDENKPTTIGDRVFRPCLECATTTGISMYCVCLWEPSHCVRHRTPALCTSLWPFSTLASPPVLSVVFPPSREDYSSASSAVVSNIPWHETATLSLLLRPLSSSWTLLFININNIILNQPNMLYSLKAQRQYWLFYTVCADTGTAVKDFGPLQNCVCGKHTPTVYVLL